MSAKISTAQIAVLVTLAGDGGWHDGHTFKSARPRNPVTGELHSMFGKKRRGLPWATFTALASAGLIEQIAGRDHRRLFRITDAGRAALSKVKG